MKTENQLSELLSKYHFVQINEQDYHEHIEMLLGAIVSNGRIDDLMQTLGSFPEIAATTNAPIYSESDIRSLKNTAIIATALTARNAVKGGINYNIAMSMSDFFISQIEASTDSNSIVDLIGRMYIEFTNRVASLNLIETKSSIVQEVQKYVQKNLYSPISTKTICSHLNLSESYLCHHFKKETGLTITQFIHMQKINEAKYLLKYNSIPMIQISERLNFSNQQQFNTLFKKHVGIPPKQWKKNCLPDYSK